MFNFYKEKTIKIAKQVPGVFKAYLPHVVFMVFIFQLLMFFGTLPYFNIINKYYYYVFGLLWIISNLIFKQQISNRRILVGGISMFVFAIPIVLLGLDYFADILGFAAFLLLFTYLLRQIFIDRQLLQ